MSNESWQPFAERAQQVRAKPKQLWTFWGIGIAWSADILFQGESYGWEVRLWRGGDFFASRRFARCDIAERWAENERTDLVAAAESARKAQN